jgi:hypothetical protein
LKAVAAERDRYAFEKTEIVAKSNNSVRELEDLRAQLAATTAERDRHAFEKSEVVAKANGFAKERDELRTRIESVSAERDRLLAEKSALERTAADASAESARLRHQIESTPPADPVKVLYDFASEKTKLGVAKARAAIPPDSPALPWFDRTIVIVTEVGCFAAQATGALIRWLIPRLRDLYAFAKGEIEARMAKKQQ